jgi:hypothetical protein
MDRKTGLGLMDGATDLVAPTASAAIAPRGLVGVPAELAATAGGDDAETGAGCGADSAARGASVTPGAPATRGASATVATGGTGGRRSGHAVHITTAAIPAAIGRRTAVHRFHTGAAGAAGGSARANAASTA